MKIIAFLNPENGICRETVSLLYQLHQLGAEIQEVFLVLENTYHAEKWVLSLSMPLSKKDIETLKERYKKKILSEWEALAGESHLNLKVEVNETAKVLKEVNLDNVDMVILGCLENKTLCKLIETLDKPVLTVKN